MAPVDQLLPLLSSCYDAASDPTLWRPFTEQLQKAFHADRIYLSATAHAPAASVFALAGCSEDYTESYSTFWYQHDIVLQTVTTQLQRRGHWSGSLDAILPFRDLRASMIYNEMPDSRGLRHLLCTASANLDDLHLAALGVWRRDAQQAFEDEETQLLQLLEPHVHRAMRLHARLVGLRAEADLLRAGVEVPGTAFLALDPAGRILLASPAAYALLQPSPQHPAGHHGLLERGGHLRAIDLATDRKLRHALHTAASIASFRPEALVRPTSPSLTSLTIPRAGTRPLLLQITPYRGAFQAVCPAALVFLTDPDSTPPSREHLLRDLFLLSPVESRLADLLLQGLELRDAGDRLHLSYDSARFHLKQVFSKTGTRRQSELLHLLARLPAL